MKTNHKHVSRAGVGSTWKCVLAHMCTQSSAGCPCVHVYIHTKVAQRLLIFKVLTSVCSYPSGVNKW